MRHCVPRISVLHLRSLCRHRARSISFHCLSHSSIPTTHIFFLRRFAARTNCISPSGHQGISPSGHQGIGPSDRPCTVNRHISYSLFLNASFMKAFHYFKLYYLDWLGGDSFGIQTARPEREQISRQLCGLCEDARVSYHICLRFIFIIQ